MSDVRSPGRRVVKGGSQQKFLATSGNNIHLSSQPEHSFKY